MIIDKIDYNSIKKELEEKFSQLDSNSDSIMQSNPEIKILFDNLKIDIETLYSIILELATSYTLDQNNGFLGSNVLLLKDIKQDFFNNLQIVSQKLKIPVNRLLTVLMENFILNDSKTNVKENDLQLSYNYLRDEILKDKFTFTISEKEFIEILDEDLENSYFKYNLNDIDIVIFKDISIESFSRKIGTIINCKSVFIPSFIPKLLIYSKIKNIENLHLYDSEDEIDDFVLIFN